MKKNILSSTRYLVLGLILLPLSLLMLFRVPSFMNLITNIMPASETTDLFGIILLFIGEGTIAYGIISSITSKVVASASQDRIIYTNAINRTMDQQMAISASVRNVENQVAMVNAKLQQMQVTAQQAQYQKGGSKCKFCGSKIGEGPFCPACGRAQS